MKLYERIPLSNGLEAEVYDLSRPIAVDTTKVEMVIKIRVALRPEYFAATDHFEQTRKVFGPEICYKYRTGQSFVANGVRFWRAFERTPCPTCPAKNSPAASRSPSSWTS